MKRKKKRVREKSHRQLRRLVLAQAGAGVMEGGRRKEKRRVVRTSKVKSRQEGNSQSLQSHPEILSKTTQLPFVVSKEGGECFRVRTMGKAYLLKTWVM